MGVRLLPKYLAGAEPLATLQQCHFAGELCEEQALLNAAVASAHHYHVLLLVEGPVAGRAEVDTGADEVLFARYVQPAVPGSRGEQDGARRVLVAALCPDNLVLPHRLDRGDGLGGQYLHAEALDLGPDPVGELAAADSVREARIVVDPLGYAGLTPDAAALDDKGVDAFAGRVQRRRESGWASPYDDQVIVLSLGSGIDSQLGGQLRVGGLHQE